MYYLFYFQRVSSRHLVNFDRKVITIPYMQLTLSINTHILYDFYINKEKKIIQLLKLAKYIFIPNYDILKRESISMQNTHSCAVYLKLT